MAAKGKEHCHIMISSRVQTSLIYITCSCKSTIILIQEGVVVLGTSYLESADMETNVGMNTPMNLISRKNALISVM